jgi:hypothetical protein
MHLPHPALADETLESKAASDGVLEPGDALPPLAVHGHLASFAALSTRSV